MSKKEKIKVKLVLPMECKLKETEKDYTILFPKKLKWLSKKEVVITLYKKERQNGKCC